MKRRTYAESCRELERLGWIERGSVPANPLPRRPLPGDEEIGISFFRTRVEDAVLTNLTIPRTFFGRSEVARTSFANSDLTESTLCWNDFGDVDFTDACLAGADLRASNYQRVRFARADLRGADLRGASYEGCSFVGARMDGAKLVRRDFDTGLLSSEQARAVEWHATAGEEPPGG